MTAKEKRAAESTLEALMYSLRSGAEVLARTDVLRRLSELSDKQMHEVLERLQKFKPEIAAAWKREELKILIAIRKKQNATA